MDRNRLADEPAGTVEPVGAPSTNMLVTRMSFDDDLRAGRRGVELKRRRVVSGFAPGDGRNQQGKDASAEQQAASGGLP